MSGHAPRSIQHALIPAAGQGTRVHSITGTGAKELITVDGKPVIAHAIQEALESGCSEIGVILRRDKEDLVAYLRSNWANTVQLLWQSTPEGLGDALLAARSFVETFSFAVILPDDLAWGAKPAIKQLIDCAQTTGKSVVGVAGPEEMTHPMFADCGRIGLARAQTVATGTHRATYNPDKAANKRAVIGRYVLPPESFGILDAARELPDGELGEGPVLRTLAQRGDLLAFEPSGECLTIGVPDGYRTTKKKIESPE
jgi:UTP--glucose-1-phosphate uridylyltransferase